VKSEDVRLSLPNGFNRITHVLPKVAIPDAALEVVHLTMKYDTRSVCIRAPIWQFQALVLESQHIQNLSNKLLQPTDKSIFEMCRKVIAAIFILYL